MSSGKRSSAAGNSFRSSTRTSRQTSARRFSASIPRGRQIATRDGLWLALVTGEGRPVPNTDAERAQALRTMIAYTGRYRIEDGKVITKVEAAWNEAWVGGEQTRFVRFEGDRLFIESPPMPHPNRNNEVVRVIVIWEREK